MELISVIGARRAAILMAGTCRCRVYRDAFICRNFGLLGDTTHTRGTHSAAADTGAIDFWVKKFYFSPLEHWWIVFRLERYFVTFSPEKRFAYLMTPWEWLQCRGKFLVSNFPLSFPYNAVLRPIAPDSLANFLQLYGHQFSLIGFFHTWYYMILYIKYIYCK